MSKPKFTSPKIANKMAQVFGNNTKTVVVDMKYTQEVNKFALKIRQAHETAGKSRQMFKS